MKHLYYLNFKGLIFILESKRQVIDNHVLMIFYDALRAESLIGSLCTGRSETHYQYFSSDILNIKSYSLLDSKRCEIRYKDGRKQIKPRRIITFLEDKNIITDDIVLGFDKNNMGELLTPLAEMSYMAGQLRAEVRPYSLIIWTQEFINLYEDKYKDKELRDFFMDKLLKHEESKKK